MCCIIKFEAECEQPCHPPSRARPRSPVTSDGAPGRSGDNDIGVEGAALLNNKSKVLVNFLTMGSAFSINHGTATACEYRRLLPAKSVVIGAKRDDPKPG